MKGIKNVRQGFTLLELLVVVLIIGILASIALPQYEKSVEKARVAEALLNIKAIEGSIQRYVLKNGYPNTTMYFDDFADIELSGGEWIDDAQEYDTKDFAYMPTITSSGYGIEVYRNNGNYVFLINTNVNQRQCITLLSDMGRYICKYLESQGWEYSDQDY